MKSAAPRDISSFTVENESLQSNLDCFARGSDMGYLHKSVYHSCMEAFRFAAERICNRHEPQTANLCARYGYMLV